MTTLCHHCRHAVPEAAQFCPECGAPQLRVGGEDTQEQEPAEPGPRHTGDIAWPAAVGSAALFSIPAGVLFSFLFIPLIVDLAMVVACAAWTLRRYRRRCPRAPGLTQLLGGRIGLVVGLFAAVIGVAGQAVLLLVERFGLHRMTGLDADVKDFVDQFSAFMSVKPQSADSLAYASHLSHFLMTPQGHASFVLILRAVQTTVLVLFGWFGGRFAVRFGWVRRTRG
jgi:hypothetical protein